MAKEDFYVSQEDFKRAFDDAPTFLLPEEETPSAVQGTDAPDTLSTSDYPVPKKYTEDDPNYLYERRAVQAEESSSQERKNMVQDEDFMGNIRYYMHQRFQEDGKQGHDETNEVFYDRFMTHFRWATNNSISILKEQAFLRNASAEANFAFGKAYEKIENEAPTIWDMSAGKAASALGDHLYLNATDPLTLATTAAGIAFSGGIAVGPALAVKQFAQKEALKKIFTKVILGRNTPKHVVNNVATQVALSGSTGVLEDRMVQELEQQGHIAGDGEGNVVFDESIPYNDRVTDINRLLISGGIGAISGVAEGYFTGKKLQKSARNYLNRRFELGDIKKRLNDKYELEDIEARMHDAVNFSPVEGDVINTEVGKGLKDLLDKLNVRDAGNAKQVAKDVADLTKTLSPEDKDRLIAAKMRTDVVSYMDKFATNLFKIKIQDYEAAVKQGITVEDDTLFSLMQSMKKNPNNQATDITKDLWLYTVKNSTEQDFDVIERALNQSGDLKRDGVLDLLKRMENDTGTDTPLINILAKSFRETKSDAGRILQAGSELGKARKAFFGLKKKDKLKLDKLFGAGDPTTKFYEDAFEGFQKMGRVRRSLMVINPATTVRNIFSGAAVATFGTAANTIESIIYNTGKYLAGGANKPSVGKTLKEIWLDSTNLIGNLGSVNARAMVDASLIHNPKLAKRIFRSNSNFDGDGSMPGVLTFLNGLNIAQDAFFRRSVFAYELDKGFRRAGIEGGAEGVLRRGKHIPTNVLEEAAAATMKATLSYAPRKNKGLFESTVAKTLDFIETVPSGTVSLPFARFMYNAMAFQFKYSPANVATTAFQSLWLASQTAVKTKSLKEAGKSVDLSKLAASSAQSAVGTAAIMAALKIRSENQDQPYYNMRVGDTIIDTRPLFPLTPYLLVADFLFKYDLLEVKAWNKDIVESMIDKKKLGWKELAEGIAGLNIRHGTSLPGLDVIFDELLTGGTEGLDSERSLERFGKVIGEYGNSFFTGTNFVKDVLASFDDQEALLRDYNADIEGNGGAERGLSAFGQTAKRVLPASAQEALGLKLARPRTYAYREPGEKAYRESALLKQITGATVVRQPTDVETEMESLNLPEWIAFRGSGDKAADNYIRQGASQFASGVIQSYINNPVYQALSYPDKKLFIKSVLEDIRKEARVIGETFSQEDLRAKYAAVKASTTKEINAILKKDGGVTDANEATLNTLKRKELLYKNYDFTGPFARYRWLERTSKDERASVNIHLARMKEEAKEKQGRGEELADYESILLLAPRPTVESSGLYGLGHYMAKKVI